MKNGSDAVREMPPLTSLDIMPMHPPGERSAWGCELRTGILPALDEYIIE